MTLFTLAGALISASYVCCVALATSAALYNRFFEGFLSPEKKGSRERERERTTTTKTGGKQREQIHPRADELFQTNTNGYDSRAFLSACRLPSVCRFFLSLGLISMHVEIEAIGEDS